MPECWRLAVPAGLLIVRVFGAKNAWRKEADIVIIECFEIQGL
jgi:hypothetical protein